MLTEREAQELEDEIVAAFVFGGWTPIHSKRSDGDNGRCGLGALGETRHGDANALFSGPVMLGIAFGFDYAILGDHMVSGGPFRLGFSIGRRAALRVLAPVPVETVPERDKVAVE